MVPVNLGKLIIMTTDPPGGGPKFTTTDPPRDGPKFTTTDPPRNESIDTTDPPGGNLKLATTDPPGRLKTEFVHGLDSAGFAVGGSHEAGAQPATIVQLEFARAVTAVKIERLEDGSAIVTLIGKRV